MAGFVRVSNEFQDTRVLVWVGINLINSFSSNLFMGFVCPFVEVSVAAFRLNDLLNLKYMYVCLKDYTVLD